MTVRNQEVVLAGIFALLVVAMLVASAWASRNHDTE
jgi:flagellar biosynthesis/type III secretory pathway M-ring protein FliF/YscJ